MAARRRSTRARKSSFAIRRWRESKAVRRARAAEIIRRLRELYPEAAAELDYRNPFQFLIAVILSAQTTDVTVNRVTPE
ncbi:MAG: endonuclease III, partial [bacterium]|nr:endonuclease III [bacterium]